MDLASSLKKILLESSKTKMKYHREALEGTLWPSIVFSVSRNRLELGPLLGGVVLGTALGF
jgi:hypothetical protein